MNFAEIIEGHPDSSTALICDGLTTSYGVLTEQVGRLRGALSALGIGVGDRVALLCGNSPHFVVSYFACLGIGATVVPLNPSSPAPELQRELQVAGAKAIVVEPTLASAWPEIDRSAVPSLTTVISTEDHQIQDAHNLNTLLDHASIPISPIVRDQLAVLMFTSGTAGAPKAAMLSHQNLESNVRQLDDLSLMTSDDAVYGVLPLFHIFGLNVMLGFTMFVGASVVLIDRFDPLGALETFAKHKITVVPGAPQVWSAIAQLPGLSSSTFAGIRIALTGSAKMPESVTRFFEKQFNLKIYEGYGLTEASPVVTISIGDDFKIGSVGRVLPGVEVRLVDENGEDTLSGDTGELWVRGDNVFLGYLDDPQATSRVLTPEGWLRTGDVAVIDDEGYAFLVDRIKDLIIVSGFNVYPAEVESVLIGHPHIASAAVVGVPHPQTGEAVRAFVVPVAGENLDEQAVIEFCQLHLARYKCPSSVLIVDALPVGGTGKVLRRELH
ncbi:MAG: AMP-binding protein [Ilumatobacteraceae bacterium]